MKEKRNEFWSKSLFTWSGGPRSSGVRFLLFSRSGGHKTKETYPTRPASPTPCKQGLSSKKMSPCRWPIISPLKKLCDSRGFNKFLHKWVLKSNMRVYLPKARRVFDPLGVRGHAPPENFEVLDSCRCIFRSFFVALLFHFFAPKSTNLNKFEENYVTMK